MVCFLACKVRCMRSTVIVDTHREKACSGLYLMLGWVVSLNNACVHGGVKHLEKGAADNQEKEEAKDNGTDWHLLFGFLHKEG